MGEAAKRRRTASVPDHADGLPSEGAALLRLVSAGLQQKNEHIEDGLQQALIDFLLVARGTPAAVAVDGALSEALGEVQGMLEALQAVLDECATSGNLAAAPAVAADPAGVRELISYAHCLSFTTRAPPGFVPGQSQLGQFQPPAPQELQFRSSQLHEAARQHQERQRAAKQAVAAAAAAAQQPAPRPAPAATAAAAVSEVFPELSPEQAKAILASMPAGWKPGDVVALPGEPVAAAAAAAPATSAAAAKAATPAAPAKAAAEAAPPAAARGKPAASAPEEEREEAAVPPAPLFSFALNQDLDYLANLDEEDFGSASEDADSSSSSDEEGS